MTRIIFQACGSLALLTGLLAANGMVQAQEFQNRGLTQYATGACQSALPVFDGQIRKRPLAVQNEGTASAFITCSFLGEESSLPTGGAQAITLYANNQTANNINLACTLVAGQVGSPVFLPKTITMPPNSSFNGFVWTAADNGGQSLGVIGNVSCSLPVMTGLSLSIVAYQEDVGL